MQDEHLSLNFLQVLNDYVCGGDSGKKAERLLPLCENLPAKFRQCNQACFRQEGQDEYRSWHMIAERRLPLRYSSWTTSLPVAKAFKGGVTPNGLAVVIGVAPPAGSVIVNVEELMKAAPFRRALETHKAQIRRYADGFGRFADEQAEVILDLETGTHAWINCLGGIPTELIAEAEKALGRPLSDVETENLKAAGYDPVLGWWLTHEQSANVIGRIRPHIPRLLEKKKAQDQARAAAASASISDAADSKQ